MKLKQVGSCNLYLVFHMFIIHFSHHISEFVHN